MCTVTFVPSGRDLFITSNRDEKQWRPSAIAPGITAFPSGNILFPKDPHGGGTWIAAHENGNAIVFLNGAFVAHTPQPPYRKSRGLILLDLLDSISPINSFTAINLNNIEPFTAVIWEEELLFECRWDGRRKHSTDLHSGRPYIWSSATLYDPAVCSKRQQWFSEWLQRNDDPAAEEIIRFHRFTGDGDQQNDLLMNRDGKVSTVSITQLQIQADHTTMQYHDLQQEQPVSLYLSQEKTMAGR